MLPRRSGRERFAGLWMKHMLFIRLPFPVQSSIAHAAAVCGLQNRHCLRTLAGSLCWRNCHANSWMKSGFAGCDDAIVWLVYENSNRINAYRLHHQRSSLMINGPDNIGSTSFKKTFILSSSSGRPFLSSECVLLHRTHVPGSNFRQRPFVSPIRGYV